MEEKEYNKLFVGGDLSGIQKFLYNITSRHASISLKGRSAYLRQIMDDVYKDIKFSIIKAGGILRQEDELYCSGGKFYLITENTPMIVQAIEEYAKRVKENLWEVHKGLLSINIGFIAFSEVNGKFYVEGHNDEQNTRSGVLWKYVNADFARQKNQKFKDLLVSRPNRFFGFQIDNPDSKDLIVSKDHKVCALTGIESPDCRPLTKEDFETEGLTIAEFEEEKDDKNVSDEAPVYLPSVIEQIVLGKKLSIKNKTKTFEQYATTDNANGTKGDTYLGVLRMDVDGMGKKFIIGFDTLDAYRNFSKLASGFFENDIQNKYLEDYKKFINVIYAGGDDLFIIGRWDKVIEFAKLIHDETVKVFKPYSYDDPFESDEHKRKKIISISGGIAIVKPKFPIAKAAEMAGEAEEAAKQGEKNAFNMFGRTISWDKKKPFMGGKYEHEYDYVEKFKDKFVEYISKYNESYGFSKSILYKIMTYSEIADINIEREAKEKPLNYSYMWHMSYYMTRFMDKFKNFDNDADKKKLYTFCRSLRDDHLPKNKGRNLQLLAIAARWAELIIKDQKKL